MATKSDFAQKLLNDLRLRKERMGVSHNSNRSTPVVGDAYGKSGHTYKGSRQIKALESVGAKPANLQRRSSGGNSTLNAEASSKQIVPAGRGRNSEQKDLSLALAFALENGGKFGKMDSSGTSAVLSFLHETDGRSMYYGKMEGSSLFGHRTSTSRSHPLSHLHIQEIARGAQNLNQILRACSNGRNFDGYSIQIGKELLKGAIDLEESLRMLVDLQQASDYMIKPQRKSRIRLLEEDEEEEDVNIDDQKQLDLPRFSFDKPSRTDLKQKLMVLTYPTGASNLSGKHTVTNSNLGPHTRSASRVPDFKALSAFFESNSHSGSSQSKREKGRISNVIAKLMGLEELPENTDSKIVRKGSSSKQQDRMVLGKNAQSSAQNVGQNVRDTKSLELPTIGKTVVETTKMPLARDVTSVPKTEKLRVTRSINFRGLVPDGNSQWKDPKRAEKVNAVSGSAKATIKQQNNASQLNQPPRNGKEIQRKERRQDKTEQNEQKGTVRSESKEAMSKDEPQQKAPQKHRIQDSENKMQENTIQREKRSQTKVLPSSQTKSLDGSGLQPAQSLRKFGPQEEKQQTGKRELHSEKQNFPLRKHVGGEFESQISSKPIHDATRLQKKQLQMNQSAVTKYSSIETVSVKKPPSSRHQEDGIRFRSSINSQNDYKSPVNGKTDQFEPLKELGSDTEKVRRVPQATEEKLINVSVTQKRTYSTIGHKSRNPQRINEVKTVRNEASVNLTRPLKRQTSILQGIKQKRLDNIDGPKRAEQGSSSRSKVAQRGIIRSSKSEVSMKSSNGGGQLQNEAEQVMTLFISKGDECKSLKVAHTPIGQNRALDLSLSSTDRRGPAPGFFEDQILKPHEMVSNPLNGANEGIVETSYLSQNERNKLSTPEAQVPLTENEMHLKEILMRSQLFVNTAEALFKLNIPVGILHGSEYNSRDDESKLLLDCCYEVMKRKGRKQELTVHPFVKISISYTKVKSLDDLVKQLYKDTESLRLYSRNGSGKSDTADYLRKMLERDTDDRDPDLNCMWDYGWMEMMLTFLERDDTIRDVEKHVLNLLIDEMTIDLLYLSVSV